jgi:hypothetical protein
MASLDQMVDRNLRGTQLERAGREDAAIVLYEANVADGFDGDHPYDRLRAIHTRRKDLARALQVCAVATERLWRQPQKAARFREHVQKLRQKIER